MCGILGALPAIDEARFKGALDRMTHRGPDGWGVWKNDAGSVQFGHRRLSILDLSEKGKQPMHYGRYTMTYNGEVFNFLELRKELGQKGYQFTTDTDTEVIIAAYQEWGSDCLSRFNGMWAIAIWDKETQELFVARDRYGIKPLYYSIIGNQLYFASEVKALLPLLPEVKPSSDFEWCFNNLMSYESTNKCLVEHVKRFPAGHYARYKVGETTIEPIRYWNTMDHLVDVPEKYEDQVEQYRELFIDACKIRMRSDVPLGTALSGGLDSSAVISTMAHVGNNNLQERDNADWQHAFVATFPGTFLDESYYAEKVVKNIGVKAEYFPIDPSTGWEKLYDHIYMFEDIFNTSPIPMSEIYRMCKSHGITVSVDGHGADEMLAGYNMDMFKALYDAGMSWKEINQIVDTYKGSVDIEHEDKIIHTESNLTELKKYFGGNKGLLRFFLNSARGRYPKEDIANKKLGTYNKYLYELFHTSTLPTLLRNYDRYSMANSIEIRMPFMDYRLVNYSFSIPWQSKLAGGFTKSILRDAIGPFMPEEVTYRRNKVSFLTPLVDWIKGPWEEGLRDTISSTEFNNSSVINAPDLRQKVEHILDNEKKATFFGDATKTWIQLNAYLWEQVFIKGEHSPSTYQKQD